ncbi:hypothetical protein G6N74_03835 [Mesorhizobium sp. CGMCC 1.15528]|uniref:HTH luxR-type domain-containing protein n=1 Tax=Mesorhizobium zhangyense TaxID=1776730 RepID=A0A7C9V469_9HYPH|nr:autoinducer binding domain-containing protein [Mesorhizobium zhangyense]NGN40185.1 hypothetical protein [Mesorhizobium zhangyense]
MLNAHSELLDFIERAERHPNLSLLVNDFSQVIDRQGFNAFIMTGLPSAGIDVEPMVIANHWPEAWSDRYREQVYFPDDPVSKWSITKDRPFHWREAWDAFPVTKRVQQLNGEAAAFGLVDGIAFPLRTARRWQAVVSLASHRRMDIDKKDEGLLYCAAVYFQMAANDLASKKAPPPPSLSDREQEILKWAAAGKTAWEISTILNISESTTRTHQRHINAKLDTANTTQAVMEAIRQHIIHV